ncbi:MAG: methylated-DNA--[protein]-cysteine S-methyltransferase [Rhodospirillales bacterium]
MSAIVVSSPLGPLTVTERDGAIATLDWADAAAGTPTPLLERAGRQLQDYFDGRLRSFDLPLAPDGTPFLRKIWRRLATIPYGKTVTYGALARATSTAPRAVGMACGRNPIPIIIPCHRVIGLNGAMTGYSGAGGLDTKKHLLEFELSVLGRD